MNLLDLGGGPKRPTSSVTKVPITDKLTQKAVCRGEGNGEHGIARKIGQPTRNAFRQLALVDFWPHEITNTTIANEKGGSGYSAHLNTHHRLLARGLCPAVHRAQRLCPLLDVRSGELCYRASGRF